MGDGVYVVAIAWQVYELSDSPTALGRRGVDAPSSTSCCSRSGLGPVRVRRRIMIAADVVRAGAATIGVLPSRGQSSLASDRARRSVRLRRGVFGSPSRRSSLRSSPNLLLQANSLDQFIRPFAFLLVGPALGGWIVAAFGPGEAFVLDAATFLVSATAIFLIRRRGAVEREEEEAGAGASILRDLRRASRS